MDLCQEAGRQSHTPSIMEKFRQRVHSAFYIRYIYAYVIVNVETGLKMVYYKWHKGSPWMKSFAKAESWLNAQETGRLNPANIERPHTKWVFVKFCNIQVKTVLNRQPMLGTGRLPDWLRNLARGRAGPMVTLDTFDDNSCHWRCIAVRQRARPDRSTQAARELAQSFLKQKDISKISLDALDKVETNLNQGTQLTAWLGIRVYEPERQQNSEIVSHLRRNPSEHNDDWNL